MALDDFDSLDSKPAAPPAVAAKRPANPDDEDLFDFPVVEMKLEADTARKTAAPAPLTAPVAQAAPVAKPPAPPPPAAAAPAPALSPAPASSPAPAKPAADVAKAAQLVEDIEQVLASESRPKKRAPALRGPAPLTLVGIGALLLTNVLGLVFLWRTSDSLQAGVQAMNERMVETLRRQSAQLVQPEAVPRPAPAGTAAQAPVPLEAFEKTALQMAREEIQAGEYAAARRRLSRLLATADRIEAESRENIEAEASFLLASTYRKQAEAAREKSP
jgi:hypothetical protein